MKKETHNNPTTKQFAQLLTGKNIIVGHQDVEVIQGDHFNYKAAARVLKNNILGELDEGTFWKGLVNFRHMVGRNLKVQCRNGRTHRIYIWADGRVEHHRIGMLLLKEKEMMERLEHYRKQLVSLIASICDLEEGKVSEAINEEELLIAQEEYESLFLSGKWLTETFLILWTRHGAVPSMENQQSGATLIKIEQLFREMLEEVKKITITDIEGVGHVFTTSCYKPIINKLIEEHVGATRKHIEAFSSDEVGDESMSSTVGWGIHLGKERSVSYTAEGDLPNGMDV